MTTEQKRIKIAEACGYYRSHPDYFHDLNVAHEAERALTDDEYAMFRKHLCDIFGNGFRVYSATAAQRAEAFGLTLGLWRKGE